MPQLLIEGALWYFVFVLSTVLHEAGHAWAALKLGDDTAYRGGQVSLDPVPHIRREPIGMVVIPLLTWFMNRGTWMMGWASAPYDPLWAQRYPRRSAWMAMAGPAANLSLVLAAALLIRVGMEWHVFHPPLRSISIVDPAAEGPLWEFLAMLCSVMFKLNLVLFTFNLLPVPPLDGGAIPLLFLSGTSAAKYQEIMWNRSIQFFGLFVSWKVFGILFPKIMQIALDLLYPRLSI